MLPTMPLPPALPGNLIRKGRATNTANPGHLLQQLLSDHLASPGQSIINYPHHIPSMLLLYDLLHVHRPGRRSFIKWENTRVRDFGIPSHVARIMLSCSLTPMYPMRVEPRLSKVKLPLYPLR